jgi:hypothetical protein
VRRTIAAMRNLLSCLGLAVLLAACGGDDGDTPTFDAPPGTPDAPGAALTCEYYCATINANCTGDNIQYSGGATCMASCLAYNPGALDEMTGNTLGCRIYHAEAAAGTPGLHCRHAGPGGDGQCGDNCTGFCTLVMHACETQGTPPYLSEGECVLACNGFETDPPYSANEQAGNSLACRMYHATAASTVPGTHCGHTAEVSDTCQ